MVAVGGLLLLLLVLLVVLQPPEPGMRPLTVVAS